MAKRPAPKSKPEKPQREHRHHGRDLHTHEHLVNAILELEEQIMALSQTVTDALAAQDAKIADAAAKVDAFIAAHQGNSAADDQAVVDALAKQGAAVDAISAKLV
jgi:hypothetical protein